MSTFQEAERGWVRRDPSPTGCSTIFVLVVGPDDNSALHHIYPCGLDLKCCDCWLSFCHSEGMHQHNITKAVGGGT